MPFSCTSLKSVVGSPWSVSTLLAKHMSSRVKKVCSLIPICAKGRRLKLSAHFGCQSRHCSAPDGSKIHSQVLGAGINSKGAKDSSLLISSTQRLLLLAKKIDDWSNSKLSAYQLVV